MRHFKLTVQGRDNAVVAFDFQCELLRFMPEIIAVRDKALYTVGFQPKSSIIGLGWAHPPALDSRHRGKDDEPVWSPLD